MALMTVNFYSEALGMQTEVLVILPQKSALGEIGIQSKADGTAYKTLYLLHGLSDDQTIWMRRTSIERYAAEYGICVVMPCGGRSFYCDMKHGLAYYTFIAKELPRRIREFFRVSDKREDTFIAGLSMGGYGALKLALREPETFCAAAGLSPVCDLDNFGHRDMLLGLFGETKTPNEDNLSYLADKQKENPLKPRLYMAIGTADFLYESSRPLYNQLKENYDFTYYEEPNAGHSWSFWDAQIQNVLKWMFQSDDKR